MSAACTRAEMLRATDPAKGAAAYRLADAFCEKSRLRIRSSFDALWHNTDAAGVRLAGSVLEREYLWLEEGVLDLSEGTGPWVAVQAPGPSSKENQRRRYR